MITRPISANPTGTGFSRFVQALVQTNGFLSSAAEYAETHWRSSPEVLHCIQRSGIDAGDSSTSGWASQLKQSGIASEVLTLLSGASVVEKLKTRMFPCAFEYGNPV